MRHSATAATPRGTTPSDGLLTRIVAKPYARRSCETNYQRLPANGVCHEKSSSWPKPSCFWPLNVIQSSESADSQKRAGTPCAKAAASEFERSERRAPGSDEDGEARWSRPE